MVGQPILDIDLRWPVGATINPTWTVSIGGQSLVAGPTTTVGSGSSAQRVRAQTLVTQSGSSFLIRIENEDGGFDETLGYTLQVNVHSDPDEGVNRNDTADTAVSANVPSVSSGTRTGVASGFPHSETIVATNDIDWYRIDRAGMTDRSLIYLRARTPNEDPQLDQYYLQMTVFEPCDVGPGCAQTLPQLASGKRLRTMYLLPLADGPANPQEGGDSPNYLETQLPLSGSGNGVLYVAVNHMTSAFSPTQPAVAGFSRDVAYTLDIEQRYEPDAIDRTSPDNKFEPRPLRAGISRESFRLAGAERGFSDWSVVDSASGGGFVVAAEGTFAEVNTCKVITLNVFDGFGDPATGSTNVNLTVDGGGFVDNCTDLNPIGPAFNLSGATPTVSYNPPGTPQAVILSADGVPSDIAVVGTGLTPSQISIKQPNGSSLPRGFVRGGPFGTLRVSVPAGTPAGDLTLNVSPGGATALCLTSNSGCPNPPASNPCGDTVATSSAQCNISALSTGYDILLNSTGSGVVTLVVTDPSSGLAAKHFSAVAYTGASFDFTASMYGTGYISYAGDNDFFRIPLPGSFPDRVGMTVEVIFAQSPVELRVQASRSGAGVGVGIDAQTTSQDLCSNCGNCDARNFCIQPAMNETVGAAGTVPQCSFVRQDGDLEIWVNDYVFNDWDVSNQYQFRVTMTEGCPSVCNSFVCSQ
ncbi:MAG: hypothetical protein R3C68_10950 [Myxococcota bacterium]